MTRSESRSLPKTLARIGAVLVALSVLGCYVHDAQRRADERERERERRAEPAELPPDGLEVALPSSKGMVLEESALDPGLFLSGSKSGVVVDQPDPLPAALPSSKVLVIPEGSFLFSSKSAAPLPPPEKPAGDGKPETPPKR